MRGGGGGDDFNPAFVLQLFESVDEIAVASAPCVAHQIEAVVIHPRQFTKRAVPVGAVNFLFRQFDEAVQMPRVTPAQERVEQHGAQRGRKRERQGRVHAVMPPAVENLEQRNIGFGDGFKEPAFLKKFLMFRVAHERQVRVQDQRQVSLRPMKLAAHQSNLLEIHSATALALAKTTIPSTNGMKRSAA